MSQTSGAPQLATLEDYVAAVRERKYLVAFLGCLLGLLAFVYGGSRTEVFEAEASLVLGPTPVGSDAGRLQSPNLERERSVLTSESTARVVIDALPEPVGVDVLLDGLSVRFIPDSDVLRLSYLDSDPRVAAERVSAFATAYVNDREGQSLEYYESQVGVLENGIEAARLEVEALDTSIEEAQLTSNRLSALDTTLLTADEVSANTAARVSADAQVVSFRSLRAEAAIVQRDLERSLNNVRQAQAVRPIAASVLRAGRIPSTGMGISTMVLTFGGAIVGLLLGVVLAFLASRLDRSVRSDEGVSQVAAAPVMASLPQIRRRAIRSGGTLVMTSSAHDQVTRLAREEIRRLRSAMSFSLIQRSKSVVVVTSSKPGEGKSTIAANLATAIAQSGQRTVLVSADLRRPTVEGVIGVPNVAVGGLAGWLAGDDQTEIGASTGIDRLTIVPSGPEPGNPAELLGGKRAEYLFAELRSSFDVVIVDSPPVLAAADVFALVQHADEVLLVVNDRTTELDELGEAVARLRQVGAEILGVVRNGTKAPLRSLRRNSYNYQSNDDRPKLVENSPSEPTTLVGSNT